MARVKRAPRPAQVTFEEYLECLCAAHLASYVDSPFKERGGIMIVGPPSVLKSTLLDVVAVNYPEVVQVSDLNVQTLIDMRDQIASGIIKTLIMPDFAKLYERHSSTARNLEGHVRALTGEGFQGASFEDQRQNRLHARCAVLSAMTPKTQTENFKRWEDSGFSRRFLWSLVVLDDPTMLTDAVEKWRLIDFRLRRAPPLPDSGLIPSRRVTREMRHKLLDSLRKQPGGGMHATQLSLLARMLAVLVWHYGRSGDKRSPLKTILTFANTLRSGGAVLVHRRNGK